MSAASAGSADSGRLGVPPRAAARSAADRHLMAVQRSLRWAQEAADRGDYADALGWIGVLEAIGERLPAGYQARRQLWRALSAAPSEPKDT